MGERSFSNIGKQFSIAQIFLANVSEANKGKKSEEVVLHVH